MSEYIKTKAYDSMLISSIVTIHEADLREVVVKGETHNFPELVYVREGYSNVLIDGNALCIEKGDMIIIPPNKFHGLSDVNQKYGTAVHTIISFESSSAMLKPLYNRVLRLNPEQEKQYLDIVNDGGEIFEKTQENDNLGEMKLKSTVPSYELEALKKRLELFIIDLYRANVGVAAKEQKELSILIDFLNANITENISVEQMAKSISVSPSFIKRMVRTHYGCGPLQFFINLKINEAKRLIKESNMNFTEISEHLGFETIHYFSRQFKNRVGKSPREYFKEFSKG